MYTVKGTTIRMTRGDTVLIQVGMTRNGSAYTPQEGDVIRFAVKNQSYTGKVLIHKVIPNNTLILRLDPADTRALSFGDYSYDIEITFSDGTVDTFIAEAKLTIAPEVE